MAKQRKQEEFYSSGSGKPKPEGSKPTGAAPAPAAPLPPASKPPVEPASTPIDKGAKPNLGIPAEKGGAKGGNFSLDPKSRTDFSVNDRTDMFELSESLGTQISYITNEPRGENRFNSFENTNPYEDDKFEEEETAVENKQEREQVVDNYKRILSGKIEVPEETPLPSSSVLKHQVSKEEELVKLRIEQNKAVIRKFLGQEMFDEVYKFLIKQRSEGVEDVLIVGELQRATQGNRQVLDYCSKLDQIVYMELIKGLI